MTTTTTTCALCGRPEAGPASLCDTCGNESRIASRSDSGALMLWADDALTRFDAAENIAEAAKFLAVADEALGVMRYHRIGNVMRSLRGYPDLLAAFVKSYADVRCNLWPMGENLKPQLQLMRPDVEPRAPFCWEDSYQEPERFEPN